MGIGKAIGNLGRAVGRAVSSAVQLKVGIVTGNPATVARAGVNLLKDSVRLMGALDNATAAIFERANSSQTAGKPGMEGRTSMQLLEGLQPTSVQVSTGQAQRLLEGFENHRLCGTGLIGLDGNAATPVDGGSSSSTGSASGGSGAVSGSSGSGSATGGGDVSATDGGSLYRLFEENPAAFQEAWKGMNDSDRQMAMMQLQREMQMIQQLTTMMTNMLQTQHSATMAVARNLSV